MSSKVSERPFGAVPREGAVEFRVWAPSASRVAVRVRGAEHELTPSDGGVFAAEGPAGAGDDYLFVLDGTAWPDPCSRFQPEGVRGPSRVVDTSAFSIADGPRLALEELVLYELHVGTFTEEGTFDAVIPELPRLRRLGVTAIELMPIATFPGERGWGYDGLYAYAPHPAYGGPDGLARLVDAAHREGLGVFLDVVYNHLGPGNEALTAFGPYFTHRHSTPWGDAIDYAQPAVRAAPRAGGGRGGGGAGAAPCGGRGAARRAGAGWAGRPPGPGPARFPRGGVGGGPRRPPRAGGGPRTFPAKGRGDSRTPSHLS